MIRSIVPSALTSRKRFADTAKIRLFGLTKIPLIFFVSPTIEKIDELSTEIRIPLNYRTRNHLGSMYFGALFIGSDVAGGLYSYDLLMKKKRKFSLSFKDAEAKFLKRPEGDVWFVNTDGAAAREAVESAAITGERVNYPVHIRAETRTNGMVEVVATFVLTLSIKFK